ncbi:MAG: hypothetical protein P8J75_07775 [Actinomycetota bacterium]|nr:hypothetical protein [Actinomycetota bacterium]
MRLVLDLRKVSSHSERRRLANEADQHGIWGIVVTGPPGAECVEAAAIATVTSNLSVIVDVDGDAAHPTTLAEEVAVLDQISRRRAALIFRGETTTKLSVAALLSGLPSNGVILSPPPAQTAVPVFAPEDMPEVDLEGDLQNNAAIIDQYRDASTPFLVVSWNGPIKELARHLVGRAASPDFPQMVADLADEIDPIE